MTDETDRTIRRAVRQLGEAAPPPPSFEEVVARRGPETARSRRFDPRLLLAAPIAAGVVVIVLLATLAARGSDEPMAGRDDDPSGVTTESSVPGPSDGTDGVVVPAGLLDDAVDVDRADTEPELVGEVVVLGVPEGGVVAVSVVAVSDVHRLDFPGLGPVRAASFSESGERVGDRPAIMRSVGGMVPCVSESMAVQVGEGRAVQASGPVDVAVLRAVLTSAQVDDAGLLSVSGPAGTRELGRLSADWRSSTGGSVVRMRSEGSPAVRTEVTTVRVDAAAQDALSALRCPAPVRVSPPTSQYYANPDPAGQGPRTVDVDGAEVEVGVIDEGTQVALVRSDPGVAVVVEVAGQTWPFGTDVDLARLATSVEAVDGGRFDARSTELAEERIERTRSLIPGSGTSVVATGTDDGEPWMLVTQDDRTQEAAAGERQLCLVEPPVDDGLIDTWEMPTHCMGSGWVGPDLGRGTWLPGVTDSRFLFAVVPDDTDRLEVRLPDGQVRTGAVLDDPVDGFGRVAVVDLLEPQPGVWIEAELGDSPGAVEVRAVGSDGEVLLARSFGPWG